MNCPYDIICGRSQLTGVLSPIKHYWLYQGCCDCSRYVHTYTAKDDKFIQIYPVCLMNSRTVAKCFRSLVAEGYFPRSKVSLLAWLLWKVDIVPLWILVYFGQILHSELVDARSTVNHKGLRQGWKQTSIYQLVFPHKSPSCEILKNLQNYSRCKCKTKHTAS